jgi:hypothetical protein
MIWSVMPRGGKPFFQTSRLNRGQDSYSAARGTRRLHSHRSLLFWGEIEISVEEWPQRFIFGAQIID